jgi:hypothetical protein
MVDTTALQSTAVQMSADLNSLDAAIAALPSSGGTIITPASGGSLTDASGATWTFSATVNQWGNVILRNGTDAGGAGKALGLLAGAIYAQAVADNSWWQYSNGKWSQVSGNPFQDDTTALRNASTSLHNDLSALNTEIAALNPSPPPPPPGVPALASSWGLTVNRLSSTFADSRQIDMAGTLDSTKTWFRKNKWTNNPAMGGVWTAPADTPTNSIVTGSSGLVLSNGADGGIVGLSSAAETTPGSYVGLALAGSIYVGFKFAFDPAHSDVTDSSWPIAWMVPVEQFTTPSTALFIEEDLMEARAVNFQAVEISASTHEWMTGTSNNNNVLSNYQSGIDTALHHWEYLHILPADNGGTGLISVYMDGFLKSSLIYSATTGSNPPASPNNPVGVFTSGDTQHRFLKIAAGDRTPITVPLVEIWGK